LANIPSTEKFPAHDVPLLSTLINFSPLRVQPDTVIPRNFQVVFSEASKNTIHDQSKGIRSRTLLAESKILNPLVSVSSILEYEFGEVCKVPPVIVAVDDIDPVNVPSTA
jgi:hypothetical protein